MGMYDCIGRESPFIGSGGTETYCRVSECLAKPTTAIPTVFAEFEVCEKHYKSLKGLLNEFSWEFKKLEYEFFFHSGISQGNYGWGKTPPNSRSGSDFCDWHICRTSHGFAGADNIWHGSKLMFIPTIFGCFRVCDEHYEAMREELHAVSAKMEILKDSVMWRLQDSVIRRLDKQDCRRKSSRTDVREK